MRSMCKQWSSNCACVRHKVEYAYSRGLFCMTSREPKLQNMGGPPSVEDLAPKRLNYAPAATSGYTALMERNIN